MKNYLQIINSLVNEIKALPSINEENQRRLDKKFRLEFNYNSNHIEGNTLTYGETELLLIFDKTEGIHEMREYEEMKAHDVAFKLIQEWALDKDFRLSEIHIKQLNEIILVRPFWKEAQTQDGQNTRRQINIGNYKQYPNSVRLQNGEMFHYASPLETPMKMGDLMEWFQTAIEKNELTPVELASLFHYKFVLIHPFDDGNGRISRLLMNYVLLKNNLPPIIIKTAEKKDYLNALNQADVGNIDAFIEYIAKQLIWSLEITKKGIKGESLDEVGDLEKKLNLAKKKLGVGEITKYYSKETLIECLKNNITPVVNTWEKMFNKFDALFSSKEYYYSFGGDMNFFNPKTTLLEIIDELVYPKILKFNSKKEEEIEQLIIKIIFKGLVVLKNSNNKFQPNEIKIKFHSHNYEIDFYNSHQKIQKLYSDELTEIEINNFIEELCNTFYSKIEPYLEK